MNRSQRRRILFPFLFGFFDLNLTAVLIWLLSSNSTTSVQAGLRQFAHTSVPGTIHYVATTGDDSNNDCTATPCRTIQYAVDVAHAGDEIRVASGLYTDVQNRIAPSGYPGSSVITQIVLLTKTLTVRGGYLASDWSTSYPITQPTTLDAQGRGRVLYIMGDITATLEGLRIVDGNAVSLGGGPFIGDAGGGGAIITATVIFSQSQILGNTALIGGGLYLAAGNLTLVGSTVMANTTRNGSPGSEGGYGGGIYSIGTLTLIDSTVQKNHTGNGGQGAPGQIGRTGGWGGGIWFSNTLVLSNTSIMSNTTGNGGRGAASLDDQSVAFTGGDGGHGGGIYGHGRLTLDNAAVYSNTSGTGGIGGDWAGSGGAGGSGGGIYHNGTLFLLNSRVYANAAGVGGAYGSCTRLPGPDGGKVVCSHGGSGGNGGGIYYNGEVLMMGGAVASNAAGKGGFGVLEAGGSGGSGGSGGGLYGNGTLVLQDGVISGNRTGIGGSGSGSSGSGGGIYFSGALTMTGGEVNSNFAAGSPDGPLCAFGAPGSGGGIFKLAGRMTLVNSHISGNAAGNASPARNGGNGGGIYNSTDALELINTIVSGNSAGNGGGGCYHDATYGGSGGGIYSNGIVTLTESSVISNMAGGPQASWLSNNYGGSGGGIYNSGTLAVAHSTVSSNSSGDGSGTYIFAGNGGNGGGIYSTGILTITQSTISGNATGKISTVCTPTCSGGAGGGVFCSGTCLLTDNLVRDNTTGSDNYGGSGAGGGIYGNGTLVLVNNLVRSNSNGHGRPGGAGGGIYSNGNLVMSSNTVISNVTGNCGGGLFGQGTLTLTNNLVQNNATGNAGAGGGLCLSASTGTLVNTAILDNQAAGNGSGLYITASTPRLLQATLARNIGGAGSGIYVTNAGSSYSAVALTNTIVTSHTVGISVTHGNQAWLNGVLWFANTTNTAGTDTLNLTYAITNAITGDPAFAADGYHLTPTSAAIDQGVESGVAYDLDNSSRPIGAGYDIGVDEREALLRITQFAYPNPVKAGEQLTYTIHITNTGTITLTAIVTDILPAYVTPTDIQTWTLPPLSSGNVWTQSITVIVMRGYKGTLTNHVQVTTQEGASGESQIIVNIVDYQIYFPIVLKADPRNRLPQ